MLHSFFEAFVAQQPNFRMQEGDDNQYEGDKRDGLAEGNGKQILISQGITYSGKFHGGKKHGAGYLVN